jgi:hypothetical protein
MASAFKNAGMSVVTTDDANANLYTASGVTAVVHAVYISNSSVTNDAHVDVKVTTDGGSTFYHIGKKLRIPVQNTLVLDKPINLETNDILRVVAYVNADSSSPDVEVYASILEIS